MYDSRELLLPAECVRDCSASGAVDDAVSYWRSVPAVAVQLALINHAVSVALLYGCGAWDADDLRDHETNLDRVLWLACCDARECDAPETVDIEGEAYQFVTVEGSAPDDVVAAATAED